MLFVMSFRVAWQNLKINLRPAVASVQESSRSGMNTITPEHILIALLEKNTVPRKLVERCGNGICRRC